MSHYTSSFSFFFFFSAAAAHIPKTEGNYELLCSWFLCECSHSIPAVHEIISHSKSCLRGNKRARQKALTVNILLARSTILPKTKPIISWNDLYSS